MAKSNGRKKKFGIRLLLLIGIPVLSYLMAIALYDLIKSFFIGIFESIGINSEIFQLLALFAVTTILLWLAIGAPVSRRGFLRVLDKAF